MEPTREPDNGGTDGTKSELKTLASVINDLRIKKEKEAEPLDLKKTDETEMDVPMNNKTKVTCLLLKILYKEYDVKDKVNRLEFNLTYVREGKIYKVPSNNTDQDHVNNLREYNVMIKIINSKRKRLHNYLRFDLFHNDVKIKAMVPWDGIYDDCVLKDCDLMYQYKVPRKEYHKQKRLISPKLNTLFKITRMALENGDLSEILDKYRRKEMILKSDYPTFEVIYDLFNKYDCPT